MSIYFQSLVNLLGRVVYRFSNGLGCLVPCESLDEFSKTGTHLRARGGCHVLTFPDRGVTQTPLCNRLGNDLMNDYLIKYIDKDIFETFDNKNIIQCFQNIKL